LLSDVLDLVFGAFSPMVPLVLAGVGEVITERSGVVNIGLEGIMLLSALTSGITSYFTGNVVLGLAIGLLTGIALGILHAILGVYLRGDQIVIGVGVNLFAYGIAVVSLVTIWETFGNSPQLPTIPKLQIAGYSVSPMLFLSILVSILAWYLLFRTDIGLKLRACGEDPRSAEAMGVNVNRMRLLATVVGAALTGLGGAHLSIDWVGQFTKEITAGRGFIALANVVFSKWNPIYALLGGFVFGFFDSLAIYLSIVSLNPSMAYLFKTVPYIATLIVVSLFMRRARIPPALGKPYIKE